MSKKNEISIVYENEQGREGAIRKIIFAILFNGLFAAELFAPLKYYLVLGISIAAIVLVTLLMQLCLKYKRVRLVGGIVVVAAAGVIVGFFSKLWQNGGTIILNAVIDSWNRKNGTIYYLYVTNDTNVQAGIMLFALTFVVFISVIVNLCLLSGWYSVVVLLNFVFFAYYIITDMGNNFIVIVLMLALLIAYIATIDTEKELIQRSRLYWVIVTAGVLLVTAGVVVAVRLIPDKNMDRMRQKIVKQIETKTFGEPDLCDGDLTDIPDLKESERVRLEVVTDCTDAVYLKGFVGSAYTGNSWTDLPNEAYQGENKAMQQYLIENQYSPLVMLSMFFALSEGFNSATYDVQEVSYEVENISASGKYIYIPYTSQRGSFAYYNNINRDVNVRNSLLEQMKSYTFDCLEIGVSEYPGLYNNGCLTDKDALDVNTKYLDYEQAYHEYADQYYREVPYELRSYFDDHLSKETFVGAEEITEYIRKYLKNTIVYSEEPTYVYSGDGDFIIELLDKNKQGHSVHYATAATMMFRYYGIPARYVEGYRRPSTGARKTNLYQRDAHAWVEIYRYGMGWVPIDVTPGYYVEAQSDVLPAMDQNYTPPESSVMEGTHNGNSESGNPPPQENDADDFLYQMYMALWWLLILLLVILLAIIIRRLILLHKQKKRIQGEDWKDSILFMAGLIWRLCKRGGISIDQTRPEDCKDEMNEAFQAIAKIDFNKILSILNRVNYSDEIKEEDDYIVVKAYMDVVRSHVYGKSGPGKKLRIKYIDVLC